MIIFRWAMLGTGMASRNLLLGLRNSEFDAHVTAVTSGAKMNSERFARDFKVPHVSESYEAACAWSEADAVCIATPPGVHEIYALMAIAAGKPTPLKKPVDMDATSTNQIASAARSTKVFCMEAMWTRFPSPVRHVKKWSIMAQLKRSTLLRVTFPLRSNRGHGQTSSRPSPSAEH